MFQGLDSINIPTCIDYVPTVYANIDEFQELARVYNIELQRLQKELIRVFNNFYIESLDEDGCNRWEKILKLRVNSTYTLEDRRFNIMAKLKGNLPYTMFRLREILSELLGEENYIIDMDYEKMHMEIKLNLGVKNQLKSISNMLEEFLPLNITYTIVLLYNTHEVLARFTHEELARYTHEELRSEVLRYGNN